MKHLFKSFDEYILPMNEKTRFSLIIVLFHFCIFLSAQGRKSIDLNNNWYTTVNDSNVNAHNAFFNVYYPVDSWNRVNIPHTWDKYEGYRRLLHGNRHGYAWYRKTFSHKKTEADKRFFLFFEGVGSYATVWLNGKQVGTHAGGRTTFTLDVTNELKTDGSDNVLAVRADHPADIRNLPWVCGGCSPEWGFSEGSQPFGIFRPVRLIITNDVRVEPFGVHIWNDTTVSESHAGLHITTEIKNYSSELHDFMLIHKVKSKSGEIIAQTSQTSTLNAGEKVVLKAPELSVQNPQLWSIENPYLYTVETEIWESNELKDITRTSYGIRWISWPIYRNDGDKRFYLNGKPVFINGTAEYEHMLGNSHAFTDIQVNSRVMQMKAAGFNAFRDAHQPHNLRYQEAWDSLGILFWTQMAAHIWFDNEEFKTNFKQLLRDWVKERRNCPSVILWGLENESTLPEWFAKECTEIIREMDPTSPSQRLVTTCNGGTGTDWNVIQNWSGTYAGDLFAYDKDISRELLNGEYGAWRSIDLHTEGNFNKNGAYSEDRMCLLMETKVRLAEQAKGSCCGQFQWIFNSHDNPGRTQNGEGIRELDRIGPVNYKGLITPWGELLDVYYMYRSNYVDAEQEPMAYIVSHSWPNRWKTPGLKDSIIVYSSCDEVELFNGYRSNSLGRKKKGPVGTHFQWDQANIQYNMLYAVGYKNGRPVCNDLIVLHHLPKAPGFELISTDDGLTQPDKNAYYVYRLNCGGPEYTDKLGNVWHADFPSKDFHTAGSRSWTSHFKDLPPFLASQRRTFDPILNSLEWKLFQTFRYGRDQLSFNFPVPDGQYVVELYFIEPWYGTNGSMNCEGWRVFDVAVNNDTLIRNLDIWKETGHDKVLKKTFPVNVKGGRINIHFPQVISGQAIISAIAICSNKHVKPASCSSPLIQAGKPTWKAKSWMDIGDTCFSQSNTLFTELPSNFYGCEWIQTSYDVLSSKSENIIFTLSEKADVFLAVRDTSANKPAWFTDFIKQHTVLYTSEGDQPYHIYARRYAKNDMLNLNFPKNGNYILAVNEVHALGNAADQRPKTRYQAEEATLSGTGFEKLHFKNRDYIRYKGEMQDTITWEFKVGLGDVYSLQFNCLNNENDTIPMQMKIFDMYGVLVKDEILQFPNRKDSWRSVKTTTGTSINAGTYTVHLISLTTKELGIDSMDVQ